MTASFNGSHTKTSDFWMWILIGLSLSIYLVTWNIMFIIATLWVVVHSSLRSSI